MAKYKFENELNECLERLLSGTETIKQCLQRYPDDASELEPLLRTAASIHKAVDVTPSPELKARVLYNLRLKMAEVGKPRRASWWGLQPRWASAAVAVMLVFVLGGGAVLAADSSMPGSPLYPIKIITENISLKLASSDIEKAELSLTFADRRVEEMDYMMANSKYNIDDADEVASRYIGNLDRVTILSSDVESFESETGAAMTEAQRDTTAAQSPATLSGAAVPTPSESEETTEPTPPPQVTLTVPPATTSESTVKSSEETEQDELNKMIQYYTYNHPKKLDKWLSDPNVPEKNKIVIRRMLQNAKGLKTWK